MMAEAPFCHHVECWPQRKTAAGLEIDSAISYGTYASLSLYLSVHLCLSPQVDDIVDCDDPYPYPERKSALLNLE